MKIQTKAVHAGDRKRTGGAVPVTTPIYTAASFFYDEIQTIDRIFGHEEHGFSYSRYDNPTSAALEELIAQLENGAGALACSSGMMALYTGLVTALTDRRRRIVAAHDLYGATIRLLLNVMEPQGYETYFADVYDEADLERALAEHQPACVLMESISNPLLRVGAIDRIAEITKTSGAVLVVDSTFATPLLLRPLDLGANIVVHSATKYLGGHGDVLGGLVVTDEEHFEMLRTLSRTLGPVLGPFESYMTMRGIKTFALRMERQCQNAAKVASWLRNNRNVERVYYPDDPDHPDAATIARVLPDGLYGAMVSFEIRGAGREAIFAFINRLSTIVPATSLGDVHSMLLYPMISSHRDLAPKQRERMGIRENLVRLSVGIEAVEDIVADLDQALSD